jgi:hypothetical protein
MGKTKRCKRCGKQYKLGYNGTKWGCDTCLGVKRDNFGRVWFPTENEATFYDIGTGKVHTISRKKAFE